MRKVALFAVIASLCLIGTIAYAAPFAAHLDSSAPNLLSGGSVDLEFTLSEDAKTVTVEVIGPLPASTVQRTFNLGALGRGDQSVAWDGKNQVAADVPLGGYKFTVKADSDGYGSSWTNITPLTIHDIWTTGTTELGIANTPNLRGVGFNGTNMIIVCTSPYGLYVVNSSGELQNTLGLTVVDTYDADNDADYAETWAMNAWLGPYDAASATDGTVYVGTYRGAGFPISRIEADDAASSPVAVAFQVGHSRATDVVNAGASTIIYEGGNAGSAATRVHTSTDGTTFSLLEATAAMPNSHIVIGRDGNTGGDGDVLWCSTNAGNVERWVRSAGVWAEDTSFSGPVNSCGGDYASIGGKDVIAVILNSTNDIVLADGDTGTQITSWSPPARITFGGNGDLTIDPVGAADFDIYFVLPDCNIFGKIRYGGIGDLQYWTAIGMPCIEDQTSEAFGYMFVGSSYPEASSNPGATADQQGVYILKCDGTFYGGTAAAAYAAADNNPSANWDSGDNWSPWRGHAGVDDNVITFGDWGTNGVSDDVMMYYGVGTGTTARQMLLAGGAEHGRIYAAITSGTLSNKWLVGLDRDLAYGQDMYYWEIGETIDNYTGARNTLIDGPSITGSGLIYSMKDFAVDPNNHNIFLANSRWSGQQDKLDCVAATGDAIVWLKTGDDLATDSLGAFHQNNYTYSIDYSDDKDWVAILERSTNPDVVVYSNTGTYQSTFSVGSGISATYQRNLAFAPAGNLWISDNITEHSWIWAPPGASNYATTLWDAVYFGPTPVPTPSPTATATPTPTPTPAGLEHWVEY